MWRWVGGSVIMQSGSPLFFCHMDTLQSGQTAPRRETFKEGKLDYTAAVQTFFKFFSGRIIDKLLVSKEHFDL